MNSIPQNLTYTTYQAGMLQSKAHRALTTFMTESLKKDSLSMPQWAVLGVLYESTEQRPFQIAEQLGVRPPVATALVNELEVKKLIIRKIHATDSRATNVALTRQGKQLVTKVERRLHKELHKFLSDITIPELAVYTRVLAKLATKV